MVVPPGYTPGRCISAAELVPTRIITWSIQEKLYEEHKGIYAQKHQTATSLQLCRQKDGAPRDLRATAAAEEEEEEEEEEGNLRLHPKLDPNPEKKNPDRQNPHRDLKHPLHPDQPTISPRKLNPRSSEDNREGAKVEEPQMTFQT